MHNDKEEVISSKRAGVIDIEFVSNKIPRTVTDVVGRTAFDCFSDNPK